MEVAQSESKVAKGPMINEKSIHFGNSLRKISTFAVSGDVSAVSSLLERPQDAPESGACWSEVPVI